MPYIISKDKFILILVYLYLAFNTNSGSISDIINKSDLIMVLDEKEVLLLIKCLESKHDECLERSEIIQERGYTIPKSLDMNIFDLGCILLKLRRYLETLK